MKTGSQGPWEAMILDPGTPDPGTPNPGSGGSQGAGFGGSQKTPPCAHYSSPIFAISPKIDSYREKTVACRHCLITAKIDRNTLEIRWKTGVFEGPFFDPFFHLFSKPPKNVKKCHFLQFFHVLLPRLYTLWNHVVPENQKMALFDMFQKVWKGGDIWRFPGIEVW